MSHENPIALNHQISEEAAAWLVEFRIGDIDAAGRRDFDDWVRASAEHLRAFMEMAAIWNESGAIDAQRRLDVDAIIARAKSEPNVIGLSSYHLQGEGTAPAVLAEASALRTGIAGVTRPRTKGTGLARVARLATAASLLIAIVGAGMIWGSSLFGRPTYSTGVGQQRAISLPDGSTVVLDSRSLLRVDFSAAARQVELLRGQALFHVARNPQRPFLVRAGEAVIRDVGTQFDVNRRGDGAIVTVVEGRVEVVARAAAAQAGIIGPTSSIGRAPAMSAVRAGADAPGRDQPMLLTAGEQVNVLAGDLSPRPIRVSLSSVTAWTHGQVVLESATLQQVAAAFDRYSTRRLVAEDRGSTPLRLSGVFATNPDFLIRYLRERPDIAVTETDSEIDIVRDPPR